jgi:V/A-type H+-transporting ATPase subunit E
METGKDKVKKICDILRRETLEPARQEADTLVDEAKRKADEMIADARKSCDQMIEQAKFEIERQRQVFQATLSQASRQAIDTLKETIQTKLFNPALSELMAKPMKDPEAAAKIVNAIVKALEKEGLTADLSAYVSSALPAAEVNKWLASDVLSRLKEKGVLLSGIAGGAQVKIAGQNITVDISDGAVKDMIINYIRKDFRDFIFGA